MITLLPPEPPTLSPRQAGVVAAGECLRLAFTARALAADPLRVYDEFGEWCHTCPRLPRLPSVPPFPVPDPHRNGWANSILDSLPGCDWNNSATAAAAGPSQHSSIKPSLHSNPS